MLSSVMTLMMAAQNDNTLSVMLVCLSCQCMVEACGSFFWLCLRILYMRGGLVFVVRNRTARAMLQGFVLYKGIQKIKEGYIVK